jgi:hypothetical protein
MQFYHFLLFFNQTIVLSSQKSLSLQHYKFKTQCNERTSIKGNARGRQARLGW